MEGDKNSISNSILEKEMEQEKDERSAERSNEYYKPYKNLLTFCCFVFGALVSFGYNIVTISA